MPHALRIYKALKAAGLAEPQAMCIAEEVERARSDGAIYDGYSIVDRLCDGSFTATI